jgi:hypothetical protein
MGRAHAHSNRAAEVSLAALEELHRPFVLLRCRRERSREREHGDREQPPGHFVVGFFSVAGGGPSDHGGAMPFVRA